jgi:hypothetical protein
MSDKPVICMLAVIVVLVAASLSPAHVYAGSGSGSHNSGHASNPSGNGGTSGTNRNMPATADRTSGKPVSAHPMGFTRCYRACMAGPAGGGMYRFCRAACSR